jgi:putative membrane protein
MHHHHYWWVFVPIVWALIITAVVLLWRRGGPRRGPNAKEILAERFARGEIVAEEYRSRLAEL